MILAIVLTSNFVKKILLSLTLSVAFSTTLSRFGSWAVFDLSVGRLGLVMGRSGHTENLWAVLVWAVLVVSLGDDPYHYPDPGVRSGSRS